jgi:hypothetical protein
LPHGLSWEIAGCQPRCGNHRKIERRADVQARIAWLRRDEDEVLRRISP